MSSKSFCNLVIPIILISISFLPNISCGQAVTRLTLNAGTDYGPAWDPRGETIVYIRSKTPSGSVYDAYKVLSSGQGGEQAFLTGLNADFGVATGLSWIGSSGNLSVEEAISGFEILNFNTAFAPFNRIQTNGSDSANTLLLSINGGGGCSLARVSRDGKVALVRFSTTGSGGAVSFRAGTVSSFVGGLASNFGNVLASFNVGGDARYLNGAAISPDGSQFVLSAPLGSSTTPHDILIGPVVASATTTNLTNTAASGFFNVFPDFSPDGTKIAFARKSSDANDTYDLYSINIDGSGLTQLTNTPNFSEITPSWSGDGKSIAFSGIHTAGHETETPALAVGEAANYNIYSLTLPTPTPTSTPTAIATVPATPTISIVTPKTKITEPPTINIQDKNVTFTFVFFSKAEKSLKTKALLRKSKPKLSFQYNLVVNRTQGKKKEVINKTTKKNSITLKNLKPGNYSAKYQVAITQKDGSKVSPVGKTKFSPPIKFSL